MVVVFLSYYYANLARQGNVDFFRLTVHTRSTVPLFFVAFILIFDMRAVTLLFAVGDLAGAVWTAMALRSEGHELFKRAGSYGVDIKSETE